MTRWAALLTCLLCAASARAAGPQDVGVEEHVGARLPLELALRDTSGRRVALGDYFTGRPVLLILAYSRCTMLCNLILRGVTQAVRRMDARPGADYRIVSVSLDPTETSDEAARQQQTLLAASGATDPAAWSVLIGSDGAVHTLADRLGYRYWYDPATRQYAHPSVIFTIAPDGRIRRYIYGIEFPPNELAEALTSDGPSFTSQILRCFRVGARRYRWLVFGVVQLGAIAVFVALVGLLFRLSRRRAS